MKKISKILALCGILFLSSGVRAQHTYTNPVMDFDMPDPTVISADDGYFYLYATEGHGYSIPIVRSSDLVNWERIGAAFSKETRPTFEPKGGLWAPDINRLKKQYLLYYSMSYWGGSKTCGIGVATADSPQGPFKDHGPLFRSNTIDVFNSIDPEFVREKGRNYLFWGSFWGIYAVELTKDGLAVKAGSRPKQIAGGAFEAAYVHKRDGYYYLFASIGSCCEGLNSTYTTVVGRSRSLMGPYTDKSGKGMLDNGYEVVIRRSDRFVGPGHNSDIVTDKAGDDWLLYHAVDSRDPRGRKLLLDKIEWVDGWPTVRDGRPSDTPQPTPLF